MNSKCLKLQLDRDRIIHSSIRSMETRRTLTTAERVFVIKRYYESGNSYKHVQDNWADEFQSAIPSKSTMHDLISKFNNTGSVVNIKQSGRPVSIRTDENKDLVAAAFTDSPTKSIRRASVELSMSYGSVQRMLVDIGLKPYKPHLLHKLNEDDPDRRLQFCETFLGFTDIYPDFVDNIMWSDEATFKTNGHVNRHNSVYWCDTNPFQILQKDVNAPGITVWCGLSSSGLVGPYFFEGTVNGESYLKLLKEQVWPILSEREDIHKLHFQQDGAPPHYATKVREWLDEHFPGRWFGRRGPVEWPARSPDLTPLDFFLWGVIKNSVYGNRPRSIADLRASIQNACDLITPALCAKVCGSVGSRYAECVKAEGQHFEQFRT